MKRVFKMQFHDKDDKDIFVLSCHVVSEKRFHCMTDEDKKIAILCIEVWEKSLQGFKQDLQPLNPLPLLSQGKIKLYDSAIFRRK